MSRDDSHSDESAPLLEVGRILRSHGVTGDVVVELFADRPERVAPGTVLATDLGPLTVSRARPHQGRWIVTSEQIESPEAARRWQQVVLRAPAIADPDELWVHELIGCRVIDAGGVDRGSVESVQQNPASDLLVLGNGALVPLTFLTAGPTDGRIDVDVPAGLFELYEPSDGK